MRVLGGVGFVGAEFVVVVVVADILEGVLFFGGAERTLGEAGEFWCGKGGLGRRREFEETLAGDGRGTDDAHVAEELAPVQVDGLGSHVGVSQIWRFADQHHFPPKNPWRCGILILLR